MSIEIKCWRNRKEDEGTITLEISESFGNYLVLGSFNLSINNIKIELSTVILDIDVLESVKELKKFYQGITDTVYIGTQNYRFRLYFQILDRENGIIGISGSIGTEEDIFFEIGILNEFYQENPKRSGCNISDIYTDIAIMPELIKSLKENLWD